MNKISLSIAAAALGLITPLNMAIAGDDNVPLSALTGEWWQWAASIPAGQNPQSDPNGQFCMIGQRGDIWFLAGVLGGGPPVARACSVPENTALFFPVINNF